MRRVRRTWRYFWTLGFASVYNIYLHSRDGGCMVHVVEGPRIATPESSLGTGHLQPRLHAALLEGRCNSGIVWLQLFVILADRDSRRRYQLPARATW